MAIEKIHRDDTTRRRHRESYWIFEPFGMNIDSAQWQAASPVMTTSIMAFKYVDVVFSWQFPLRIS